MDKGGSSDADIRTFDAKNFEFSKFMVCSHGQRGFERVRTFFGQGFNFSRFSADVFYGRPLRLF